MGKIGVYMIIFYCIHVWDSKEKEDLMSNGYEVKAIPVETKITNWDIFFLLCFYNLNTSHGLRGRERVL